MRFRLNSFYDDENHNREDIISQEIDDTSVINSDVEDDPYLVNIDYVEISDENGKVIYKDDN